MNLSKFKINKALSDKTHTMMQHEDGHQLKIRHGALSAKMRKEIEKLKMADGGEVPSSGPCRNPNCKSVGQAHPNCQCYANGGMICKCCVGGHVEDKKKYADGGAVDMSDVMAPVNPPAPAAEIPVPAIPGENGLPINPPIPEGANPPQKPTAEPMDAIPEEVPAPAAPAPAPQSPSAGEPPADIMHAYKQEKAGIQQASAAQQKLGQEQEKHLTAQVQATSDLMQKYQSHVKQLDDERQALQDDIKNSHIDPSQYLGSQESGSRIATAIGLMLGGMGGGGTSNLALDFVNKQIDRDIEAQKANLGKKENLLSANMKQYGNLRDATDMTKIMMNDIVSDQLKAAAAKAATPMAKADALKQLGQLEQQVAPIQQQMALRQMLVHQPGDAKGTPQQNMDAQMQQRLQVLRRLDPAAAKEEEERYVPGVGNASIPVPNDVRQTLIAKQTLNSMAKRMYDWSSKHSGSVDPKEIAVGKTMAAELQSLYRNSINGGVFKKGEQEFIDNIITSDPAQFFNSMRSQPRLKEVIDSNKSQLSLLKKGYGLPNSSSSESPDKSPEIQRALAAARANPNHPKAKMILEKYGQSE